MVFHLTDTTILLTCPQKNMHRHRTRVTCGALVGMLMTITSNSWCPSLHWAPWKQSWALFWVSLKLVHSSITAHLIPSMDVCLNICLTHRFLWGPMMAKKYSLHHHSFTQQISPECFLWATQWGHNRVLTWSLHTHGEMPISLRVTKIWV